MRNVFARETLEEAPAGAPARRRAPLARSLFAAEELALDAEVQTPPRVSVLRMIFAPEVLPEDPVPPPGPARAGLLRALFVAEALPELPALPRKARSPWLRWLFRFESLDPPGR